VYLASSVQKDKANLFKSLSAISAFSSLIEVFNFSTRILEAHILVSKFSFSSLIH